MLLDSNTPFFVDGRDGHQIAINEIASKINGFTCFLSFFAYKFSKSSLSLPG